MHYRIRCTKCGHIEGDSAFRCGVCGSILEVVYDYDKVGRLSGGRMVRYSKLLPVIRLFSLKEGGTPLKKVRGGFNGAELFLKLETENPTRTFKDRGSAVEMSKALEVGAKEMCCASTGNMGFSLARYARRAGIKATVFISKGGNARKISKIRGEGARIIEVDGDFNSALNRAEAFAKRTGCFLCGDYHFRKEGQKTVTYEIIEQLGRDAPDYLFMPVGNATLLAGAYKGLLELKRLERMGRLPRIVAVQSEGCDPLVRAYRRKGKVAYMKPRTEADAIAVGYPTFGFEGLGAIRGTKGAAVSVPDKDIERAVRRLEGLGVYAELGGGTAFAGLIKAANRLQLKGKRVVVVVTGNNEGVFR